MYMIRVEFGPLNQHFQQYFGIKIVCYIIKVFLYDIFFIYLFYFTHRQYIMSEVTLLVYLDQSLLHFSDISLRGKLIQCEALNKQNISVSFQSWMDKSLMKLFCLFKPPLSVFKKKNCLKISCSMKIYEIVGKKVD